MISKISLKNQKNPPFLRILGIRVHAINCKNALSLVEKWVETNKQYQIVTPNPEQVVLAQKNLAFRRVLNEADLAIPDGAGLVWAGRRVNVANGDKEILDQVSASRRLKRLAGIDFMLALCKLAAKKNWRIFLLGGRESAAIVAGKLQAANSKLRVGSDIGARNIRGETEMERKRIIKKINEFKPHLLFVAYGAPYQELWIAKNLPKLKVKIAMGVGGAFDYLAGTVKRAPFWVRSLGLEWFYRLLRQPWRLKRQLALLRFIYLIFRDLT